MWANNKVVLDYLPGNTGDIRWLPGKHIDILPQEGNERAFLFVIEGGADGESTISARQPCRELLHLGCSNLRPFAAGTLWQVINRRSALRRDTLPGFLVKALNHPLLLISGYLAGNTAAAASTMTTSRYILSTQITASFLSDGM